MRTAEHEILLNLLREPGQTQQMLAQRCFTAKSHMSGLIGTLQGRGWIRREPDPADARAWRLFLEPAGAVLAKRTMVAQRAIVKIMTAGLPIEVIEKIRMIMDQVADRLKAEPDEMR